MQTSSTLKGSEYISLRDCSSLLSPSPGAFRATPDVTSKRDNHRFNLSNDAHEDRHIDLAEYSDMEIGNSSEMEEILEFPTSSTLTGPSRRKFDSALVKTNVMPYDGGSSRTSSVEIVSPPLDSSPRESIPSCAVVPSFAQTNDNDTHASNIVELTPTAQFQIPDAIQVLPREVDWKSACAATKSQRDTLSSSFIFTAYDTESIPSDLSHYEEDNRGEELVIQERMGLGCCGVRKENSGVFDRLLERIGRECGVKGDEEVMDTGELSESL